MRDQPLSSSLHEAITALIETTRCIHELDLEEETNLEVLERLQSVQLHSREQIEHLWSSVPDDDHSIRTLMDTAYEWELKVNRKLKEIDQEVSVQLHKIQEGNRMKKAYQHVYSQSDGYFVDRKK